MKLYQLKMVNYDEVFEPKFIFDEFEVISETDKTYLIETRGYNHIKKDYFPRKRRILKDQNGKRFAYNSKQNAVKGFLFKRKRYQSILKSRLKGNELVIEIAEKMIEDINYVHDFGGW